MLWVIGIVGAWLLTTYLTTLSPAFLWLFGFFAKTGLLMLLWWKVISPPLQRSYDKAGPDSWWKRSNGL